MLLSSQDEKAKIT